MNEEEIMEAEEYAFWEALERLERQLDRQKLHQEDYEAYLRWEHPQE